MFLNIAIKTQGTASSSSQDRQENPPSSSNPPAHLVYYHPEDEFDPPPVYPGSPSKASTPQLQYPTSYHPSALSQLQKPVPSTQSAHSPHSENGGQAQYYMSSNGNEGNAYLGPQDPYNPSFSPTSSICNYDDPPPPYPGNIQ